MPYRRRTTKAAPAEPAPEPEHPNVQAHAETAFGYGNDMAPPELRRQPPVIRETPNTWWCPDDDRAMTRSDRGYTPCDVCGLTPDDFR